MAIFFIHRCNKCHYEVKTSGPHEFYRDENGQIQWYGHPGPVSEVARKVGVHGLEHTCYCPKCDKTFSHIALEFPSPVIVEQGDSPWFHLNEGKANYNPPKCPDCGNTEIVFNESGVSCPRCSKGKLIRRRDIMRLS